MDIKEKARKISVLRASRLVLALDSLSGRQDSNLLAYPIEGYHTLTLILLLIKYLHFYLQNLNLIYPT